ncbi:MAG: hypothetical protein SH818_14125 [Saprospiraceae bacterium]|nr:hypothetical protein [Saprospiraceae bacterium]
MTNTPKVWVPLWYSLLFQFTTAAYSQADTFQIQHASVPMEDVIQAYLESRQEESGADFETVMERLELFKKSPINLHAAGQPDLDEFILLAPLQINALRSYILKYGRLLSLFELQVVPGFDIETIRRISPYISLDAVSESQALNLSQDWRKGENQILLRTSRILEPQLGYQVKGGKTPYTGDPYKYYFRFHHQYSNRLSLGFHGEKDAGETFFKGYNPRGFDFYSYHLGVHRLNKFIDDLVLGDYSVSLGQGLLIQTGFGVGKNALTTSIQRGGRAIKPYSSANEFNYFRGLGTTLNLNENLELVLFYSNRNKDGTMSKDGTSFSSFLESGYHRTTEEIVNEKRINEILVGQAIKYKWKSGSLALNALYNHFDHEYLKTKQLYNTFSFKGNQLLTGSLDHQLQFNNFLFFGESAMTQSGGWSAIQGLQWSLDKTLGLALLYRNLNKNFPGLYSSVFSENTLANNELGFYLGLEWKPALKWKLAAYQDFWKHPWYKFSVTGPSQGREYFMRITYTLKRKLETYLQYKTKIRQENRSENSPLVSLNSTLLTHWRIQINHFWPKGWESRTRLEYAAYENIEGKKQLGLLLYQDLLYHPLQSRFSFTSRMAYFTTEDYESRIYAYENDILGNFSVPAFSDKGFRYYFNFRFDITRNLMLEGRWAQTHLLNQLSIGSGLDEIQGNNRTELKAQLRWKF